MTTEDARADLDERLRDSMVELLTAAMRLKLCGEVIGRRRQITGDPRVVLTDTMRGLVLLPEGSDPMAARTLLVDLMAAAMAEVERIDDES